MIDGIYSITFRGLADWGMGLLVLQNGTVTGADVGGVLYDGVYSERGDTVEVRLSLTVPPGVTLVQGTRPQATPYNVPLHALVPKRVMDNNQPHLLNTPLGPVNVIFRKLRELVE